MRLFSVPGLLRVPGYSQAVFVSETQQPYAPAAWRPADVISNGAAPPPRAAALDAYVIRMMAVAALSEEPAQKLRDALPEQAISSPLDHA